MHYFTVSRCQCDRVILQQARLPQDVQGAAPMVPSWASWILFKFSKSWKVLISKYFLGSASLLAVSSPPDFDTNNLIEKSGRGTGVKKNRERKKEKYLFQQTATKWESGRGVQREDDVSFVWGDFQENPLKQSPPTGDWFILLNTFNFIGLLISLIHFSTLLLCLFAMCNLFHCLSHLSWGFLYNNGLLYLNEPNVLQLYTMYLLHSHTWKC